MITIKLTKAQHEVVKTALTEVEVVTGEMIDDGIWTERDYKTFQRACYQIWSPHTQTRNHAQDWMDVRTK